jgi:hypothetical protein
MIALGLDRDAFELHIERTLHLAADTLKRGDSFRHVISNGAGTYLVCVIPNAFPWTLSLLANYCAGTPLQSPLSETRGRGS